jgi:beta-glucuronidase
MAFTRMRTTLLLFAATVPLVLPALAESAAPPIANPDGRRTSSLGGDWRTIVDPYENGFYDYRYRPSESGYFKDAERRSPADLIEYDFDRSPTLKVPGDWNSQRESLLLYEGAVWYRTLFDDPHREGERLFVYFGAANYRARVYLNGEKLGEHEGGFTPFNFEITDLLRHEGNSLVVQVDSRRLREGVPTLNTDWWNYGGLTRRVLLIAVPRTFIRAYHVQLAPGSLDRLAGWLRLDGPRRGGQTVRLEIPEAGLEHVLVTDGDGFAEFELDAELALWSPDSPRRYRVVLSSESDSVEERIGFRAVASRDGEILLNGEPVFLRGISLHEEAPLRPGRAHSREDARRLLGWAKGLGANFVRLAHYPHNAFMVEEAERLGLLVWAEIPVYWTIQWSDPRTWRTAAEQLAEMIERDRNRAAVILWSVGNETPLSAARLDFMRRLVERARGLDPTRLVTAALEHRYLDETTLMIDDPLGEHLDVLGCNEYVGWYDGPPAKADRLSWRSAYAKPLVMSELGGGALAGHHGDAGERWTEEYQEELYRRQIDMLRRIPFLRGMSPWILVDFRSPRRHLPQIQDFWNRKGLISDGGHKKKAFFVLQSFYRTLAACASPEGRGRAACEPPPAFVGQ